MLWELQKWASYSFCSHGTCSLVGIELYDEVVQKCLWLAWEGSHWSQEEIQAVKSMCQTVINVSAKGWVYRQEIGLKRNENAAYHQSTGQLWFLLALNFFPLDYLRGNTKLRIPWEPTAYNINLQRSQIYIYKRRWIWLIMIPEHY